MRVVIRPGYCAYRAKLTADEQRIYDRIVEAMAQRERGVTVPGATTVERMSPILNAINHDQPFLYDVDLWSRRFSLLPGRIQVSWAFQLSDGEAAEADAIIVRKLRGFRDRITRESTALRREALIHNLFQEIGIEQGNSENWYTHCIYGPLVKGETVCEGASMLFYTLCVLCGIPCMKVLGTADPGGSGTADPALKPEPHSWNIVRVGRQYVHVDAFWDACLNPTNKGHQYAYFNLSDRRIARDHSWERKDFPVCLTDSWSYFALGGLDVRRFEDAAGLIRRKDTGKELTMSIRVEELESRDVIAQKLQAMLMEGGRSVRIAYQINEKQRIVTFTAEYD